MEQGFIIWGTHYFLRENSNYSFGTIGLLSLDSLPLSALPSQEAPGILLLMS